MTRDGNASVVVVGGGFAGVACAKALAKQKVKVTLIDRNNYHQFQPLLYQVATAQIAAYDIARPLHGIFRHDETGLLVDPHTAVGIGAARAAREPGVATVALATAHPGKFPDAVEEATGRRPELPPHLGDLFERPERTTVVANDLAAVEAVVARHGARR